MGQAPPGTEVTEPYPEFISAGSLASAGQQVVVTAEAQDGAASPLVDLIPEGLGPVIRVVCAPAGRARVGGVAEDLDLDAFHGGVLIVEDAQWADPTSLGRLQRLVRESAEGLLLVVAHRPVAGVDGWWIDRLAEAARRHASLVEIELEIEEGRPPPPDLEPREIDLVLATLLVSGPISIPTASRLLDSPEAEVLEQADGLVRDGWLDQARGGYLSTSQSGGIDAGEARIGYVAGQLASIMEEEGAEPAVVGSLRMSAGQPGEAFPLLAEAALDAHRRRAAGEAFHLAEAALQVAQEAGVEDRARLGELHLVCGRFLRSAGRTDWAASHLDQATSLLEGPSRIDALGFAAAVADDRQHPQESERILAVAEWEAAHQAETAKLGSLLTFRARALNRIGFAEEADAVLERGLGLLGEESSPVQRFHARLNRAWIHFDRGEASRAATEFTRLRDEAGELEGDASVADKEAWRARALFASGRPREALAAVEAAEELAGREDVEAPLFLAQLALSEGGLALGRYQEALAAADRALDLVERQLPAWENMVRSHRATALLRLGRTEEAGEEITAALEASPPGSDGWRWRTRCRALQMEIAAQAGERWPAQEAEDLADLMLQSRFYGWAAELLCAIAEHGKRKGAAREGMALAVQLGNPMMAARAAHAGGLWGDPAAASVIRAIRVLESQVPPGWEEDWRGIPAVIEALQAPEPTQDGSTEAATEALEQALQRAGLAGAEVILSPAQRRSRGLVRRPRAIRPLSAAAAAVAVVVVAAGTALGVAELTREDPPPPPPIPTTAPATTVPLALEETPIPVPEDVDFFFGTAEHRGGYGRSGFVDTQGPHSVSGYYWTFLTAGRIDAAPVAFGRVLLVGSTDGTLYAMDQTTGNLIWTLPTGEIHAAPALGELDLGEARVPEMVVVAGDDGFVRAREAISERATEEWSTRVGTRVRSSPVVVDETVWVATVDGFVFALSLLHGEELWRYPEEGEGIGPVSADLAYHQGVLYVGTEDGSLHLIDVESRMPICQFDAQFGIVATPMIVDEVVYVPTRGQSVWALPPGECGGAVPNRHPFYVTERPVEVAPAVVGDVMYLADGLFLYKVDLVNNFREWPDGTVVRGDAFISTSPVVAGDTVYFGTEDGVIHAVDAETGVKRWEWRTGRLVRGPPAVVDGVAFIVSGDGTVYAVGE